MKDHFKWTGGELHTFISPTITIFTYPSMHTSLIDSNVSFHSHTYIQKNYLGTREIKDLQILSILRRALEVNYVNTPQQYHNPSFSNLINVMVYYI